MKILVTGAAGQVGAELMRELTGRGYTVIGTDRTVPNDYKEYRIQRMDITEHDRVRKMILDEKPEAVMHCAAWTAVDAAEEPANRDTVYAVNSEAPGNIAKACAALNIPMLYLSTDYVFDGSGSEPWQPDDRCFAPLNVYGASKLAGEEAVRKLKKHFIVRTSWVFGPHGKNYVRTMADLGRKRDVIKVVCDQIGRPTYAPDLSVLLADMIETDRYGYYHATNSGDYLSWYDFAREIMALTHSKTEVLPVSTDTYGAAARRPLNSRLDQSRLMQNGFLLLPHWRNALIRYLNVLEAENNGTDQSDRNRN